MAGLLLLYWPPALAFLWSYIRLLVRQSKWTFALANRITYFTSLFLLIFIVGVFPLLNTPCRYKLSQTLQQVWKGLQVWITVLFNLVETCLLEQLSSWWGIKVSFFSQTFLVANMVWRGYVTHRLDLSSFRQMLQWCLHIKVRSVFKLSACICAWSWKKNFLKERLLACLITLIAGLLWNLPINSGS